MSKAREADVAIPKPANDSVGLALGGGGARGLAHILALEVFDELGLRPNMIAGTSIGAIFGGAYATGLTAAEIRERAEEILSRPAEIARRLFSGSPRNWMELWTLRPYSAALMNPERLVEIVFPEAAEITFPQLAIPFRTVATDYWEQSPVTIESGNLCAGIAASMALPALFRAMEHEGRILVDGGLTDPLPYGLLQRHCGITVAVDVTGRMNSKSVRMPKTLEVVLGSSQIMQNAIIREQLKRRRPDILIRPPVDGFRILEFYKIDGVLAAAAPIKEEMKDGLKRALEARVIGAREKMI